MPVGIDLCVLPLLFSVPIALGLGLYARRYYQIPGARPSAWIMFMVFVILVGIVVPVAVDLSVTLGIVPTPGFMLTPVIWIFAGVLFAYALYRYRMFDLTPVAHGVFVEGIADMLFVLDAQGRLLDLNAAAAKALDRDKNQVIAQHVTSLPAPWCEALAPYCSVTTAKGELSVGPRTFDLSVERVAGRGGWPSGTCIVLHEVTQRKELETRLHQLNSQLEALVADRTTELNATLSDLGREFADHKRAQDALGQPEERHRLLFETMTQGVVYHDAGGKIVSWNPAAERLMILTDGIDDNEPRERRRHLVNENGQDLAPDDLPWSVALRTGLPIRDRTIGEMHASGAPYRWFNVDAIPLFREGDPRPYGVYSTLQDVTERKQIEEILAERVANQSGKLAALYGVMLVAGQSLSMQETCQESLVKVLLAVEGQAAAIHQVVDGRWRLSAQIGLTSEQQEQVASWECEWLANEKNVHVVTHSSHSSAPGTMQVAGFDAYLGAPIRLQNEFAGGLSVLWAQARSFSVEEIAMFRAIAEQLGVIVENVHWRERIARTAVVNERRRLARELHDSVTQSLHSLVLTADNVRALAAQGRLEQMDRALVLLSEASRQALKEMRLLLYELRLKGIDQLDLVEQLQLRLDAVERRAGIDANLIAQDANLISGDWHADLYAIVMEALNNSLKYARATRVSVSVEGRANGVTVDITDDGQGFDSTHPSPGGMGLRSMCERAERLGGTLKVDSTPGQGTRIHLVVEERP